MKRLISVMMVVAVIVILLTSSIYAANDNTPYREASSWAVEELDKAAEYGFITEKIMDRMNSAITREELAELTVRLYEKYTGKQAEALDINAFSDVDNPEVYKAYGLKIVNGTNKFLRLFSPNDLATREQVAAMFYRTVAAMAPEADLSTTGVDKFADEKDISDWALESVRYMSRNGFMKGGDGKISPRNTCTREMAVIITARIYEKYTASSGDTSNEKEAMGISGDGLDNLKQIILNDVELHTDDYSIKEKDGSFYIFIAAEKLNYAFKRQNAGHYTYPEVDINLSSISVSWRNEQGIVLQADFREDSQEAFINGRKIDTGIAPYRENGKVFIPVNTFIVEMDMAVKADIKNNILYIQYRNDFPSDILTGTWSDTKTDLFADYREITGGNMSLPYFATAYRYNADGTYGMRMVSTGDNNDTFIMQNGRYHVMGSTIICYDIVETVYSGSPFTIKHENKLLNTPQYMFIHNYDPEGNRIEIGGFWLNKR